MTPPAECSCARCNVVLSVSEREVVKDEPKRSCLCSRCRSITRKLRMQRVA